MDGRGCEAIKRTNFDVYSKNKHKASTIEIVDYDWLKKFDCIHISDKDGDEVSFNFRAFLEKLGTQGIRKYDNDFWCKCLVNTLKEKNYKKVCISDMRFINEYSYSETFSTFRQNRFLIDGLRQFPHLRSLIVGAFFQPLNIRLRQISKYKAVEPVQGHLE